MAATVLMWSLLLLLLPKV